MVLPRAHPPPQSTRMLPEKFDVPRPWFINLFCIYLLYAYHIAYSYVIYLSVYIWIYVHIYIYIFIVCTVYVIFIVYHVYAMYIYNVLYSTTEVHIYSGLSHIKLSDGTSLRPPPASVDSHPQA